MAQEPGDFNVQPGPRNTLSGYDLMRAHCLAFGLTATGHRTVLRQPGSLAFWFRKHNFAQLFSNGGDNFPYFLAWGR